MNVANNKHLPRILESTASWHQNKPKTSLLLIYVCIGLFKDHISDYEPELHIPLEKNETQG